MARLRGGAAKSTCVDGFQRIRPGEHGSCQTRWSAVPDDDGGVARRSSGMHAGVLRPTFGICAAAFGVDGRLAGILPAGVCESEREP
jgi:hypothetical protein